MSDTVATVGSVSEPAQTPLATSLPADLGSQILSKLSAIDDKIVHLDGRVRDTETALANRTMSLASTQASSISQSTVATVVDQTPNDVILSSTDFLCSDKAIQQQVDQRFIELQTAASLMQPGKLKSQRSGTVHIPIKKFVAWPHHYVLVGKDKKPPTYDQLCPTRWMAGCLKGAMDLPQPDRDSNLNYLINLLEDASDFSFENAKACHAVVLTTMEHDKLCWQDTCRLRRQHAQQHPANLPQGNFQKSGHKQDHTREMLCKFFANGSCINCRT